MYLATKHALFMRLHGSWKSGFGLFEYLSVSTLTSIFCWCSFKNQQDKKITSFNFIHFLYLSDNVTSCMTIRCIHIFSPKDYRVNGHIRMNVIYFKALTPKVKCKIKIF